MPYSKDTKKRAEDLLFIQGHEERVAIVNSLFARVIKDHKKYSRLKKKQATQDGSLV